ncbi:MAG: chemotaxis protein CheX, partial [Eubacterium sp.]|nr:chemotaxis protein CheX [Eubacterium sp.]
GIGKISADQFQTCMEYMRSNRVKLGLIAESEGILTRQQADELNRLQMQTDKRFGDLAIEKGYLTDNDISRLLKLQGNPYLIFIQALEENDFIKRSDLDDLIADFQKSEGLSNSDLEAIKFDDFDRLLPSFIDSEEAATLAALAMRNLVRFVSSYIRLERATKVFSYEAPYIAYQKTTGDYEGFLGFASHDDSILVVADGYAGEFFETPDEDALDSVCEFTNCINGLYATEESYKDIMVDMLPPEYLFDSKLEDTNGFYILPVYITGKKIDLIIKR